ncbi:branched-chain amino acid ABC transporter permease [Arthrobacter sp. TB 23]|uniref:branched-chain amino acid ABC transporter permease n=1 Tax=Arthrobacter sp. TB 23 TaxID=494419 RepID=UPI0002DC2467|nr:branched-chain amino acid ABC transporter permease [Arthrobacter sp. TB 23]
MDLLIQTLVAGILLGGVYALVSVGLNLLFGVVRVINFAHGEFVMIGMYLAFWLWFGMGIDPYLSLLIVAPAMFLIGVVFQRGILQPIQGTSANMKIFATVGISIILQNLALFLWGGQHRSVSTSYSTAVLDLGGITISVGRLVAFIGALVMVGALFYVMNRTMTGNILRAIAEDSSTAVLVGIPVKKFYFVATGISVMLAGVAGVMLVPFTSASPLFGVHMTLIAFIVVVIGGMGSMVGSLVGGVLLGAIETLAGTYISPALQQAVLFALFIIVVLVRPQGLFGKGAGTEEVGLK